MAVKRRRILLLTGLVVMLALAGYALELAIPKRDYFIERAGSLADQQHMAAQAGNDWHESVHLVSSSGLEVDMRVVRPAFDGSNRLPVVLMLGGHEAGKDGVDLVGAPDVIAFAAIDYPYESGRDLNDFWSSVAAIPDIQRAFLNSPPALSLAVTWLLEQPWADPERIELAGISLGVPFAAPAGALDPRISRVWLLHGGGDNASWAAHNARRQIENDTLRELTARLTLFAVYGRSFDTRRWIPEIAPRPLIIVMARDDDFVPKESQQPLIEAAASEYVELIWTEGRHIGPSRKNELRQLLDIVTNRIEGHGQ